LSEIVREHLDRDSFRPGFSDRIVRPSARARFRPHGESEELVRSFDDARIPFEIFFPFVLLVEIAVPILDRNSGIPPLQFFKIGDERLTRFLGEIAEFRVLPEMFRVPLERRREEDLDPFRLRIVLQGFVQGKKNRRRLRRPKRYRRRAPRPP
jgi:hypothetical protein